MIEVHEGVEYLEDYESGVPNFYKGLVLDGFRLPEIKNSYNSLDFTLFSNTSKEIH